MTDLDETVSEAVDRAEHPPESRLNSVVAILVALIATSMALCNIKDGNIVQAMAQAQAKSTKQHLAEMMVDLLGREPASPGASSELRAAALQRYREEVGRYGREKEELRLRAEGYQKEYDRLNLHDDQFDMAEAALSLSIALLGVGALTKKAWLVAVATTLAAFGAVLGLAGFFRWQIHPDAIAGFLG